jgi:hypothetical protein
VTEPTARPLMHRVAGKAKRVARSLTTLSGDRPGELSAPEVTIPAALPAAPAPIDDFDALPVERCEQERDVVLREIVPSVDPAALPPVWPHRRPLGHLGQLTDEAQAEHRARFEPLDVAHCHWYHQVPTSDGQRMPGAWDLNGNEATYLGGAGVGGIDLSGRRVFELGPATGHLTWWMEQQGAEVVAFEAGLDCHNDLIPYGRTVTDEVCDNAMRFISTVQRSWWWTKTEHDLAAKVAYGTVYDLPTDLGEFDTTVLGAVLLHLRDPFGAMMAVAAHTTDSIVVTDLEPPRPWGNTEMRFNPVEGDHSSWWVITPGAMRRMLSNVGFTEHTITRHVQWHRPGHVLDADPIEMPMYTIVARRP